MAQSHSFNPEHTKHVQKNDAWESDLQQLWALPARTGLANTLT